MNVFVVWYFDDIQWILDGVYFNIFDAEKQVLINKAQGLDSYFEVEGVK